MSVSIYKKGQDPKLIEVANKGYNATWTGTKQAAEEALAKGEIKNGTVVYITDDYNTSDSVVHADSADKALVADRAIEADTSNKVKYGASDSKGYGLLTYEKYPEETNFSQVGLTEGTNDIRDICKKLFKKFRTGSSISFSWWYAGNGNITDGTHTTDNLASGTLTVLGRYGNLSAPNYGMTCLVTDAKGDAWCCKYRYAEGSEWRTVKKLS